LRARQALSQLSYGPISYSFAFMLCCIPLAFGHVDYYTPAFICHAPHLKEK